MVGLFRLMDAAIADPNLGVKFFTASGAALEKVFMELVMRQEAAPLVPTPTDTAVP
jgi:hypothetical protein